MSQILTAADHLRTSAHALHDAVNVLATKLPKPKTKLTVPVILIAAALAAIAVLRKLVALALIAIIIAIGFVAYQSGALNHWVDKGKQVIQNVKPTPGS